ncbi:MAG: hypothetical protein QM703_01450 [Gemmatales bacterium]
MKPDLLGYVLQMLEPEEERAVEEYLETTPEARREVLRMRPLLKAMQDDEVEPSKDLIYKTLRAVAHQNSAINHSPIVPPVVVPAGEPVRGSAKLPKLEPCASKEYETSPDSWRRADAWALIAVIMLILLAIPPVLQFVRDRAGQVECRENMRQLYSSFTEYMNDHGGAIPALTYSGPASRAGIYATTLKEAGLWGDRMRLGCPPGSPTVPQSMAEVATHPDDEAPIGRSLPAATRTIWATSKRMKASLRSYRSSAAMATASRFSLTALPASAKYPNGRRRTAPIMAARGRTFSAWVVMSASRRTARPCRVAIRTFTGMLRACLMLARPFPTMCWGLLKRQPSRASTVSRRIRLSECNSPL